MQEKVLIIDDDIDTLKLVGLMPQHQGYQITAASSGEQGLEKAGSQHPDIILLDVMMPDMDGFEVARRLRRETATQATPILMFTAKSQLEDKVAGFEVGIDDYLTKPTSSAELQAHVRQLLEHARDREAAEAAAAHRGHVIAVLAARGGIGVSTVAANLAASLHARSHKETILAEFTPGRGSLGLDLGTPNPAALSKLLALPPEQITPERVASALASHSTGVKLLLASENLRDVTLLGQTQQFEALFECLADMAPLIVLDLGSALSPWTEKILPLCRDWIVVTEASHNTITHTRHLLDELTDLGLDPKAITVLLNHRNQVDSQLPWNMAQQEFGHPIAATISPAPDLMAAASRRRLPAVATDPDHVTSQQFLALADRLLLPLATV